MPAYRLVVLDFDGRHDVERNVRLVRELAEPLDGPFAVVTEIKVGSLDHRLGCERAADDLLKKIARRKIQQRFVGRIGNEQPAIIGAQIERRIMRRLGPTPPIKRRATPPATFARLRPMRPARAIRAPVRHGDPFPRGRNAWRSTVRAVARVSQLRPV